MKSLQEHLTTSIVNESVKNLFVDDVSTRRKYAEQVWKILQDAYAPIGGIKGSGFKSIEDMVNNIPFWKLSILNDEVLAVAYQYTIGDQVYQVGEFGTDGVESTSVSGTADDPNVSTNCLILKMLKSSLTNVQKPIWNLLMKNI